MKLLILCCLLIVATVAAAPLGNNPSWLDCSNGRGKAKVTGAKISPFPPVQGKNATLTVDLDFSEAVTKANFNVTVLYLQYPYVSFKGSACSPLTYALPMDPAVTITFEGLKCPTKAGPISLVTQLGIASAPFLPGGSYEAAIEASDQHDDLLFCADITFNLQ